ncbi:MAG TPA: MBOAT family O-acyltransferase [Pirellulales bacterium]|jgi:D-alanyl-lipoteichoic acid acyltransferase DltB (MBOAT superfamily)|nr:MBOAT family O-acyltransferase [Pirellulales bacterium]
MLFHTWPFLVFMLVVLPVFSALRRTPLWIPWLLAASYFFYGWWNPYYLLLVIYSTALDYLLVTLMDRCPLDRCPPPPQQAGRLARFLRGPSDRLLKIAFAISLLLSASLAAAAAFGPPSLRPTLLASCALVGLMAAGAWLENRRVWLLISIVNNLALLLFFKYARFAVENLNQVLIWLHSSFQFADPSTLMPHGWEYILPVGISFFTFQSMSYTIDFYLGKIPRERNFLRFATFVCFFPQLMAGPIERAKQMLPQFQRAPAFRLEDLTDGASLFLVGLFKKVALANYLALLVDRVYDNPANFGATQLVLATVAFAWQIFFDFSGYTDMARGIARMLGFHLVLNFNNPYLASGLAEFWQRWHISLSTWFRDYVYIPLGGNRSGAAITYRNLLIVFLVSGIWHGSAWTFAIWGLLHAAGIMLTRELERSPFYRQRVPLLVKQAWVFLYVCFAWIFFRASSLSDATLIVRRIFGSAWASPQIPALMVAMIALVWLYQWLYESRVRNLLAYSPVRVALAASMLLYLGLCSTGGQAFIYFQF